MVAAGIARDDYFAGILDTNVMPAADGAGRPSRRAVVRRHAPALLSQRPAARRRSCAAAARPGANGARRCRTSGGSGAAPPMARCCRSTSLIRCSRCRCSKGPVLDDGDGRGAFAQPPFRRALDFYAEPVSRRPGAADDEHASVQRVGRIRARPVLLLHQRVPGTSVNSGVASRRAARRLGHCALAGSGRAGRVDGRRLEPGHLQGFAGERKRPGS